MHSIVTGYVIFSVLIFTWFSIIWTGKDIFNTVMKLFLMSGALFGTFVLAVHYLQH